MALLDWVKTTSTRLFDPNRDQRITALADQVWLQLSAQRRAFDFGQTMLVLGAEPEDAPLVAERVYRTALGRAWQDEVITDKERQTLDLIAQLLGLGPERRRQVEWQLGLDVFERALGQVAADGEVDEAEAGRLARIAAGVGTTTRQLMTQCFAEQGEGILRNLFTRAMQQSAFSAADWERLVRTTRGMGLTEAELRAAIRPQAERYVEHVLADAKADGEVSRPEREALNWLMATFDLPPAFRQYVVDEVAAVDRLAAIRAGRLPVVAAPPGVALRAGEIPHWHGPGSYTQVRQLKSGPRADRHDGVVTVTDTRLVFSSVTRSLDLNHRRVVGLLPFHGGVEVRSGGKGGGYFAFGHEPDVTALIYQVAVGKANQVIVERIDGGGTPTRHIPRDVRQRVWQRYGGRCAECGSDQYLEFDHIVPVAKGGSNSEANVQLLCRACNLKKSDRI